MNKKKNKTLEDLMKNDGEPVEGLKEEIKKDKKQNSKTKWILLTILAIVLIGGSAFAIWKAYEANNDIQKDEKKVTAPVKMAEPTKTTVQKDVYVSVLEGLNLRKSASVSSDLLATIPNGTKLTVLEEKDTWYKTKYNGLTGWVAKEYTSDKNPLVYENTEYGFKMTFPTIWSGFKFYKKVSEDGSIDLFAELPTTDANYKASSATSDPGYAAFFVISVMSPAQWNVIKNAEGIKPTYLGQNGQYVFVWSSAQATPTDIADRFKEIKSVIDTFQAIK